MSVVLLETTLIQARELYLELSEDHLLTSFGRDALKQDLSTWTRVKVRQKAKHPTLSESRSNLDRLAHSYTDSLVLQTQKLTEEDKLLHRREGILVETLFGRSISTDDARESESVSYFLVGHKFYEVSVFTC